MLGTGKNCPAITNEVIQVDTDVKIPPELVGCVRSPPDKLLPSITFNQKTDAILNRCELAVPLYSHPGSFGPNLARSLKKLAQVI